MWFDGVRQPNTIYVASVSRGKDSTAMLRAIQLLGFPLDMICSVDIWATQDIPAELPPMVAFKDEWDKKCLDNFGVPVTRLCATKRERERESGDDGECHSRISYQDYFYRIRENGQFAGAVVGFPMQQKGWCKKLKTEKVDLRRHILSEDNISEREREREHIRIPASQRKLVSISSQTECVIKGFPLQRRSLCQNNLKEGAVRISSLAERCTDSQLDRRFGVKADSREMYSTEECFLTSAGTRRRK